ncbi:MAG: hypothetical protein OEU54_09075, partial [Gemmatimonadota bacterium]|nr:hypothetical protein [Gemmatimonadota bacterium]
MRPILDQLRERRAGRFVVGYAVAMWIVAQVVGFFVEQGYVGRTLLDVTLYLLVVGFFANLVVVWYHGREGHQKVVRTEAALLGACLLVAVVGSVVVANRAPGVVASDQPVVDLGDQSVAVLPFENDLSDPSLAWLDRGVSELLATDLAQVETLRVVGGQRIIDLMKQLGEEGRIVPEDQRTVVTQMAGARYMLSGRLAGTADNVILIATLVDSDTGEIAAAAREQGADVFEVVDAVSAELVSTVLGPAAGRTMASVAEMTTQNLEAYAEYQRGLEARYLFLFPEAAQHFGRAVEIDSTFALAHFQRAGVQVQLGDFGGSSASLRRARENLTHASPRDRMFIEGLDAMIGGDVEGGERLLRDLIATYPDEKEGRLVLAAMTRGREGAGPEVARLVEETLRLDPLYSAGYNDLAYTEAGRGNYDSALALIDTYVRLEPGEANPIDSRGEILVLAGRPDEGREAFRQALVLNPSFTLALQHLVESFLREDRAGDAREDLAAFVSSEDPTVRSVASMLEAEAFFWDGEFDAGLAALESVVDDPDPDPARQVNALRSLLFALTQLERFERTAELGRRVRDLTPLEGSEAIVAIISAGEGGRRDELEAAAADMVEGFRQN